MTCATESQPGRRVSRTSTASGRPSHPQHQPRRPFEKCARPRRRQRWPGPLASSTGPGDLVIADCGFWLVEFAHTFTATGANLLVRLQSNHLGTAQEELADGWYVSMMRPGKEVRIRAAREGRTLPKQTVYRVITITKDAPMECSGGSPPPGP